MQRSLTPVLRADLSHKIVVLTGARQVGKTTLACSLMPAYAEAQYLNWDIPADRSVLLRQSWSPRAGLLVLDEVHKMPGWKAWLKGVADSRPPSQAVLVTGSARMDTFRQAGESLAGRYVSLRLQPITVREWVAEQGGSAQEALEHLIGRGGFPEPALAGSDASSRRWRRQYATDLIREDVLEFSRLQEVGAMRVFFELLRERVGSPLSLASIARDVAVAPATLRRYLDILEALHIVFTVQPWHRNIARSLLQAPKVYFLDTGLVKGDTGLQFENAVAVMLRAHAQWRQDVQGLDTALHYLRTKDGVEVDFCLVEEGAPATLVECKQADARPTPALVSFAARFPQARAVQLVRELRQAERRDGVDIAHAGAWLGELDA
jgi:predicted AAA+ superfamily ATPase